MQPRFLIRTCPFRALLLGIALLTLADPALSQTSPQTFAFTGAAQTFTVPTGVTALTVVANGAQGGGPNGGKGGRVTAVLRVTPTQVLTIYVGGQNGYNGGGAGGGPTPGGAGGGGTDIRIGGTSSFSDRVLVAGGGGGAGGVIGGGLGGGLNGGPSPANVAGGSQIGNTLGNGGNGSTAGSGPGSGSGGGGGGYYGGDGGIDFGGGGGGSSYTSPSLTSNVIHTQGANTGNGSLSITYTAPAPPAAPTNLQRTAGATYTPTDISLQWTDNSTNETNFVLERGNRSSASQLITDNSIVWTAVSPNPAANTTTYRDYSATGLTANQFGYFYRIKAVNGGGSSAYANNSDGALPVTLRYFNGRMTDAGVLLAWATAREDNNATFQIERSPDARAFESIGTVPSQAVDGNSITDLTYSYLDPQPLPGTSYYRLVQADRNGTKTTHNIIALTRDNAAPVLFPNPVSAAGEAVIEPALAFTSYQISDALGRIVQRQDAPGVLSRVSLAELPAGIYLLRVQMPDGNSRVWRVLR